MKKTIAIVVTTILLSGVSAFAQGTVTFMNRIATGNAALVYLSDGTTPVSGSGYSVQLFAGPDVGSLAAIGAPIPFRSGGAAGAWNNTTLTIPTVAPGGVAQMQARAWNNNGGAYATHAQALLAGGEAGTSAIFASGPLGGFGTPPSTPPNTFGNSAASGIPNIASFNLSPGTIIPEPSVLALGALGGLALLIRRRK